MSPVAARAIEILGPHTPFAEAIVRRQAERAGFSVEEMDYEEMGKILDRVIAAAAVFVDPYVVDQLRAEFTPLLDDL